MPESSKSKKRSFPGPIAILMVVIILAAVCTWLLPAGEYNKLSVSGKSFSMDGGGAGVKLPLTQKTLDSLHIRIGLQKFVNGEIRKPVSVPGTFTVEKRNGQGFINVLEAPIKGLIDTIDIILFILIIGFMFVFDETGAMVKGISAISHSMKGREPRLIALLTIIFSFLAGSYGMAEEAFVFYAVLVPLFLAAGYDLLIPMAVIFGGTSLGTIASFSNPFSTIIASNAAGVNWMDGLTGRIILWVIITALLVWYILRYAAKIKKDPKASLVYRIDGNVKSPFEVAISGTADVPKLEWKTKLLLFIFVATFLMMIGGVVFLDWWTLEMSALFLGSAILVAIIGRINEKVFTQRFIDGARSLMAVAFIIGVARGVTIILNDGHVSDSILFYASHLVQGVPPVFFILLLMAFYLVFSLFIQSSSGMAVLTMPIIGALAVVVNIPGREVVNSYNYGLCIMSFVAPTGLVLPSLSMVNISLKTWVKFVMPLLVMLTVICILALAIGIYL